MVSSFTELSSVSVLDLSVSANIGVHDHEIGRQQALLIDATLDVLPPEEDRIGETFDYTHVASLAEKLGQEHITLIETFARRLAEACLAHPRVERADIFVCKPGALSTGLAGARTVLRKAR